MRSSTCWDTNPLQVTVGKWRFIRLLKIECHPGGDECILGRGTSYYIMMYFPTYVERSEHFFFIAGLWPSKKIISPASSKKRGCSLLVSFPGEPLVVTFETSEWTLRPQGNPQGGGEFLTHREKSPFSTWKSSTVPDLTAFEVLCLLSFALSIGRDSVPMVPIPVKRGDGRFSKVGKT